MVYTRFVRLGNLEDLDKAIAIVHEIAAAAPADDPDRASRSNTLGTYLSDRFQRLRDLEDLSKAIRVTEEALTLVSLDDAHRPGILINLGVYYLLKKSFTRDEPEAQRLS